MGCGSALGDLFILADALVQTRAPIPPSASRIPGPEAQELATGDLRSQLYKMHGEGQISEEVFRALRDLADQGKLRSADLAVHRARARRHPPQRKDREVMNALRGIRSRQRQLSEARSRSEKVLAGLEASIAQMEERKANKEETARLAVNEGDDASARLRLTEREEISASLARLTRQAQSLRDDLLRLDGLSSQLEAKEVEMEAVLARGEMADLASTMGDREAAT